MQVVKSPGKLTRILSALQTKGKKLGFVPTMGYFHEGHLSLIRRARQATDVVVVSIFVNPTQFGPREDFSRYPRDRKRDLKLLAREKVDFVLAPSVRAMYPKGSRVFLNPGPLANVLCGPKRPGHFRGVVTVVKRLFDIARPNVAYFGQKDFQQARIIQDMVQSFKMPTRVVICPTMRERDGLAMSSRNVYLTPEERARAQAIPKSLRLAKQLISKNTNTPRGIESKVVAYLKPYVDKIDYVCVVDPRSLRRPSKLRGTLLVALACFIGKTRLIDNLIVSR